MIEIGTYAVFFGFLLGGFLCLRGFLHMPDEAKKVAIAAAMMFIGYQICEFIGLSFVVVAR